MIFFINDRPIRIIEQDDFYEINDSLKLVDAAEESFSPLHLFGKLVVANTSLSYLRSFFSYITNNKRTHFHSILFVVPNRNKARKLAKSYYSIVKAAGGVIKNEKNEILMIHRLGKWDLPKGKMDKGEKPRQTAEREVEEECNVKVKLGEKVVTTWHTYTHKGKNVLKQTKWYHMDCTDYSEMAPQQEEDIDDLKWMDRAQIEAAIQNSYLSIHYVLQRAKVMDSVLELL